MILTRPQILPAESQSEYLLLSLFTISLIVSWDVIVQDTHVLSQMFAVAMDDLMNEWMNGSVLPL
jgi:hypothetical protein